MNTITITKADASNFDYKEIKALIEKLEENPKENKGSVVIHFEDIKEERGKPLFLNEFLKAWYMGLFRNIPTISYYLSDRKEDNEHWTPLQLAIMLLSTIQVKADSQEEMTFEVKLDGDTFRELSQHTAEYMLMINEREELTREEKEFFRHIIFDYTNGFNE